MEAPYSKDLRLRVLAAVDGGVSKWRVHQMFGVSRTTIDDWLKLRSETGDIKATTNYRRGPRPALEDGPEVRAFIAAHQNSTLAQLVEAWSEAKGQRLSDVTFSKVLKRRLGQNSTFRACPLGYTRKKELLLPRA